MYVAKPEWPLVRAKRLFRETDRRGHPDEPLLAATQDRGVISREVLDYRVWNPTESTAQYKLVVPGNFVISLRSFQGGIEYVWHRGIVSPAYVTLEYLGADASFYRWYFKSQPFISYLASRATGIRQGKSISAADFLTLHLPVPPEDVQRHLASFLDEQIVKIDSLIDAKRRLIALLGEKWRVELARVMTGRLTSGTFVESGIEWLGPIPSHWQSTRLKRGLAGWYSGGTPASQNDEYWSTDPNDPAYVKIADMSQRDEVYETAQHVTPLGLESKNLRILEPGTILFAMYASMGEVAVLRVPAAINQAILAIWSNDLVRPEWLIYWLRFIRPFLSLYAKSTTQDNLSAETTLNLPLLVPSVDDQGTAVSHLQKATSLIGNATSTIEKQIQLLLDYRSSLITAAVTGQLDEATLRGDKPVEEALNMEMPA